MRILKMLICTLPLAWAFAGCSEDGMIPDSGPETGKVREVQLTFNMGTESVIQTRAQRPVVSSDDWQRVTDVRIYAFYSSTGGDDASYTYQSDVFPGDYYYVSNFAETKKDWEEDDVWGDDSNENENEQYSVTTTATVQNGYYKFLAIGRDDIDENGDTETGGLSIPEWDASTTLASASLTCDGVVASEVFSGCSDAVYINGNAGFSTSITLNRIVAGILMYVENVPLKIEALCTGDEFTKGELYDVYKISLCPLQYIEEVLVAQNMESGEGISEEHPGYGKPEGDYILNLDNTSNLDNTNNTFPQEYTKCLLRSEGGSPCIGEEDQINGYFANTSLGNTEHPNSIKAGNFILPQEIVSQSGTIYNNETLDKTLYLVFWSTSRGQTVVMSDEESNINPVHWIPVKISMEGLTDEYKFPILGNHFYSLGKYNEATGEDEPIDLKPEEGGDYNLVITVNPDWDWKGELEWAD